jgi:hypothetical protein
MKRQALGKGLSSLIPDTTVDGAQPGLVMLDIDRIRPNAFQPRTDFSGLEGLVSSIKENGIVSRDRPPRRDGCCRERAGAPLRWPASADPG